MMQAAAILLLLTLVHLPLPSANTCMHTCYNMVVSKITSKPSNYMIWVYHTPIV